MSIKIVDIDVYWWWKPIIVLKRPMCASLDIEIKKHKLVHKNNPNDAYRTLSQSLIGCSSLSQKYCNLIGWHWKIMWRQIITSTCPIWISLILWYCLKLSKTLCSQNALNVLFQFKPLTMSQASCYMGKKIMIMIKGHKYIQHVAVQDVYW